MEWKCHWSAHLSHQVRLESSDETPALLPIIVAPSFYSPQICFNEKLVLFGRAYRARYSWALGTAADSTIWPPNSSGPCHLFT